MLLVEDGIRKPAQTLASLYKRASLRYAHFTDHKMEAWKT